MFSLSLLSVFQQVCSSETSYTIPSKSVKLPYYRITVIMIITVNKFKFFLLLFYLLKCIFEKVEFWNRIGGAECPLFTRSATSDF